MRKVKQVVEEESRRLENLLTVRTGKDMFPEVQKFCAEMLGWMFSFLTDPGNQKEELVLEECRR